MSDEAGARAGWLRHISGWTFVNARPARLGVAVSGGGDSMALLDLMLWHGAERGFAVEAVTVDHGLRPEAADEAALVAAHCAGRGVPHEVLRWQGWDGRGNLPAAARAARYGLIADWAQRRGIPRVALGHTRDDVAETFLMRLGRGAGLDGLSAMESHFDAHGIGWNRPLIQCTRDQLRDYLTDRGIAWSEDPTNDDPAYERTRARRILAALAPLGIESETLASVAFNLSSARVALDHYVQGDAGRLVRQDRGDLILMPSAMPPAPPETHRRLLRKALQWVSGAVYPPRQSALINLDAALAGGDRHTIAGCLVTRSSGDRRRDETLRITREFNAVRGRACPTDALWDGRWQLTGPHAPDLEIRALGAAVADCPWRDTGLPRSSLTASPAVWRGNALVSAPLAGYAAGWQAELHPTRGDFVASLLLR